MQHEEALHNVQPLRSSKLPHFVCACSARDFRFLPVCVCVLLVTFSVTCKSTPGVGSGAGWRAVLVQMFPQQFVFCNDDASIRREVAVSPSSSLWLHAVLCALCSLPKVWRHSFAGAILGKSCRASFFFFFSFFARTGTSCCDWMMVLRLGNFAPRSAVLLAVHQARRVSKLLRMKTEQSCAKSVNHSVV